MIKVPQTWGDATGLGAKLLWLLSRIHILSLVIGAVLALLGQFLTGFWDFREQHQSTINAQYVATLEADKAFEEARRRYEVVFSGKAPEGVPPYSDVARDYIQSIEAMHNLLPSTRQAFEDYVGAIAKLERFYGATSLPAKDTLDATIFYGEYRVAYDAYVIARDAYLVGVASEAGSYVRYLRNS